MMNEVYFCGMGWKNHQLDLDNFTHRKLIFCESKHTTHDRTWL